MELCGLALLKCLFKVFTQRQLGIYNKLLPFRDRIWVLEKYRGGKSIHGQWLWAHLRQVPIWPTSALVSFSLLKTSLKILPVFQSPVNKLQWANSSLEKGEGKQEKKLLRCNYSVVKAIKCWICPRKLNSCGINASCFSLAALSQSCSMSHPCFAALPAPRLLLSAVL